MTDTNEGESNNVKQMVKTSFVGLGVKSRKEQEPKSALAAFAKIMGSNMENLKDVESKKLKLEQERFEYCKQQEEKKHDLELNKVIQITISCTLN